MAQNKDKEEGRTQPAGKKREGEGNVEMEGRRARFRQVRVCEEKRNSE